MKKKKTIQVDLFFESKKKKVMGAIDPLRQSIV